MSLAKQPRGRGLLPHHHTGRVAPHHHTHFPALAALLVMAGLLVALTTGRASADAGYTITGVVQGKQPTTAPTIASPSGGTVGQVPVTVSGSCEKNDLVKIFKNDIFGGATLCGSGGSYSLPIDLFSGQNRLVARQYNALDESSPDSNTVVVTYAAGGAAFNSSFQQFTDSTPFINQLYLTTDQFYKGVKPGAKMEWKVAVKGGTPPYAVSVGWGDQKTDAYNALQAGDVVISHTYDSAAANGSRDVVIKAVDSVGGHAYLQLVAIVNNGAKAQAASTSGKSINMMMIIWSVLGGAALLVGGFWLGERREFGIMNRQKGAAA